MAESEMKDMMERKCILKAKKIIRGEWKITNREQKARKFQERESRNSKWW